MRLYYMTSLEVATKYILPERRMKVSEIADLNDPFELQPHSLSHAELRKISRKLKAIIESRAGIICFSDNWRSPVMWAHYADKHKGVCLGFDVPDVHAIEVTYSAERLKYELKQDEKHKFDESLIEAMLSTKSREWAYEREWRVLARNKDREENGFCYVKFGPALRLREIIVGARVDAPIGKFAKLVKGNPDSVLVMKARTGFQEFAMVRNKAIAAITVKAKV